MLRLDGGRGVRSVLRLFCAVLRGVARRFARRLIARHLFLAAILPMLSLVASLALVRGRIVTRSLIAVSLLVTIFPFIARCITTLLLMTSVIPAIALVVIARRRWRTLVAVVIAVTPHGTALTRWRRGLCCRFRTQ